MQKKLLPVFRNDYWAVPDRRAPPAMLIRIFSDIEGFFVNSGSAGMPVYLFTAYSLFLLLAYNQLLLNEEYYAFLQGNFIDIIRLAWFHSVFNEAVEMKYNARPALDMHRELASYFDFGQLALPCVVKPVKRYETPLSIYAHTAFIHYIIGLE